MADIISAAEDVLRRAAGDYRGRIVFLTSLGAEDQVMIDMIARLGLDIPVSTLDTGRLFPETYNLLDITQKRYGIAVRVYAPEREKLEAFVARHGINGFRNSPEVRHECCAVRKLDALRRALEGKSLWVCGLRREQSPSRSALKMREHDAVNGLDKLSPLIDWRESDVWDYIRDHRVPYNPLHDIGYPSIGCAPCTRAIRRTEDVRAGRWWWEADGHKECGLHRR